MTPALRFLSQQVWAIHPPVFSALAALLEDRANGRHQAAAAPTTVTRSDGSKGLSEPAPELIGSTAVVPVRGVIARYADQINGACQDTGRSAESLQADLLALAADPRVQRIVLRIDSPGGTVAGTSETAATIREISASGTPVTAYIDGMAASAAYWLASQADEIVMGSPTTEVGSIGVISAYVDSSRAQEAQGFRVSVFRTSPLKAPGAMGESLTREQAAAIERDLADFHSVFADAVSAGRGLNADQLAAATTGEMWRPTAAIAMGLADRVATFDALLAERNADASSASAFHTPPPSTGASMFLKKTPAPAAAAAPAAPAAAPVAGLSARELTALCAAHPTIATELADMADQGASAADLTAHAEAHAKQAAHTAVVAERDALQAKLAAVTADLAASQADLAKATAERDALQAKLGVKAAHAAAVAGVADPGADAKQAQDNTISPAEFEQLSPSAKAKFLNAGGTIL